MGRFKLTAEIRVAEFDPPGPEIVPCFWTDRVKASEDCGAQPPPGGGSGAIVLGIHNAPYVLAYRWSDEGGFGNRIPGPDTELPRAPQRIIFHPSGAFVFLFAGDWHCYRWSSQYGFGEYMGILNGVGRYMAISADGTLIASGNSTTTLRPFVNGELLPAIANTNVDWPSVSGFNGSVAFHPTRPLVFSGRGNTSNFQAGNRFVSGFTYHLSDGVTSRSDPASSMAGADCGQVVVSADGSKVFVGGNAYGGDGIVAGGVYALDPTGVWEASQVSAGFTFSNIGGNVNACLDILTNPNFSHGIWIFQHLDDGVNVTGYLYSSIQFNERIGQGPTWPELGYYVGYSSSGYSGPPYPPPTATAGACSPSGGAVALASRTPGYWAEIDPSEQTWTNGVPASDPYNNSKLVTYNCVPGPSYAYPFLHVFRHDSVTGALGAKYELPSTWATDLAGSTGVSSVAWATDP